MKIFVKDGNPLKLRERSTKKSAKMACTLTNKTTMLKLYGRILLPNLRFCSSKSKFGTSNIDFPGFSTYDNMKTFEKTPNLRTIMSIIAYGKNINKKNYLFPEKIETDTLIEGCLYAVESVTQTISTENVKKVNTNLNNYLTQDCLDRFRYGYVY